MAKYDLEEAHRVWLEKLGKPGTTYELEEIDHSLIDMLGYFLWNRLAEKKRTPELKQKVIFASLMAAYVAGKESLEEKEVAEAFFDFVEDMDIPDNVPDLDDLMDWG